VKQLLALAPLVVIALGCSENDQTVKKDDSGQVEQSDLPETQRAPDDPSIEEQPADIWSDVRIPPYEILVENAEPIDEAARKERVEQVWDEWPNFTVDLKNWPGRQLDRILPAEYAGDPGDTLLKFPGIKVDGSEAAVLFTQVGSGLRIYVITIYLLCDDEWELRYKYNESLYFRISGLVLNGSYLVIKELAPEGIVEHKIPLPGNVDHVAGE